MFKPQFAELVRSGQKRQTIRPKPKRKEDIPRVGDLFSGRQWEGAAYRSKQIRLREGEVTDVEMVRLTDDKILLPIEGTNNPNIDWNPDAIAKADGFTDYAAMTEWFRQQYGPLPFDGVLIRWKPDPA